MSLMKIVQSSQADSFDFSPLQTRSSTIEKTADGEALIETPLSAEQERPLRPRGPTIRVPKAVHVPDFVVGLLSLGPKNPGGDGFSDLSFWEDFELLELLRRGLHRCTEQNECCCDLVSFGGKEDSPGSAFFCP